MGLMENGPRSMVKTEQRSTVKNAQRSTVKYRKQRQTRNYIIWDLVASRYRLFGYDISRVFVKNFYQFFFSLNPKPGSESMSLGEIKSTVSATLIRAMRGLTFLRCRTKCWLARSVCHSGPDTSTSLHKTTRNIFLQINQQIFQLPAVILWNVC